MQLDERSPNSLSLSWTVSRRSNKAGRNRYQLMYRKKVSAGQNFSSIHRINLAHSQLTVSGVFICYCWLTSHAVSLDLCQDGEGETFSSGTTYTVLILENTSVQISDLSPATVYLFRVQALNADGSPSTDVMEHEFTTMPEGKRRRRGSDISDCVCVCIKMTSYFRAERSVSGL